MTRRRYQHGSIRKKNGWWVVRFREYAVNPSGELLPVQRTVQLCLANRPKGEAERLRERLVAQVNAGTSHPQMAILFQDFWCDYFQANLLNPETPKLKFSTRTLYENLYRKHLLPVFGRQTLSDISRVQVQQFINHKQAAGLSPQTLRHLRNLLSNVFGKALLWGCLHGENPAQHIDLPALVRVRKARVLGPGEITALTEHLAGPTRIIVLLGIFGGMRIGELLALMVEDVDLARGIVFVRRDVYLGVVENSPKTRRSEREIEIEPPLVQEIERWLLNRPTGSGWLFPSKAGTPYRYRNLLRRKLWPVCDRLNIPRFGWHTLRHTFASYAEASGQPVSAIQALLGHSSLDTTRIYLHDLDGAKRAVVAHLTEKLWPTVAQVPTEDATVVKWVQ